MQSSISTQFHAQRRSSGGHQIEAETVVRRCADAHRGRYQVSAGGAIALCLLVAFACAALMRAWLGTLGLIFSPYIAIPVGAVLHMAMQDLGVAPGLDGSEGHWKEFAQPQLLRTMELDLPPRELAQWQAKFKAHIRSGEPVRVKDLLDFAAQLESSRINQAQLDAQQMIYDHTESH